MTRMYLIVNDVEVIFHFEKICYTKFGIALGGTSHSWYSSFTPSSNRG